MLQTLRRASTVLLVFALFFVVGCGDDAITNGAVDDSNLAESDMLAMDLTLENAAGDAVDEPAGFDDAYFTQYLSEEEETDEADEADTERARRDADVVFVKVTWGNLRGAPDDGSTTDAQTFLDWSGCASTTDGVIHPLRLLKFERGDRLARPDSSDTTHTRPSSICWVSRTGPAWDGILFQIVIPKAGPQGDRTVDSNGDGLTEDDLFVFETDLLSTRIPLLRLLEAEQTLLIDDTNGATFQAFTADDIDVCPKGSLAGQWVKANADDRQGGFFRARFENAMGRAVGYVQGRWGVNDAGEQVFVGKIISAGHAHDRDAADRPGRYLGHLQGTWEANPDAPGTGHFVGRWIVFGPNQEPRAIGALRGEWGLGDEGRGGRLRGIWGMNCANVDDERPDAE